jgi:hypothetical protein
LRHPFDDVEYNNITELLEHGQMSEGATDITRPNEGDLLARHQRSCAIDITTKRLLRVVGIFSPTSIREARMALNKPLDKFN